MQTNVGPYQLGDALGTLPFGELVSATHPARSEPLAVLFLVERLAQDHRFRGLLRLEIARAGSIRHPAVARAVAVGEHAGAPYVVFERPADVQTLARAFADGDPPSRAEAVDLVRILAEGLDTSHRRRIVHGAIGPSTVLAGTGGSVTLVGIGLVGAVEEAGLSAVMADRAEAAFTAPEQRSGGRASASSDGYALGALTAALLRVQPPPAGPADPVGNVLARQCAADPGARFPTCTAFVAALAEAVQPSSTATAVVPHSPGKPPVPPPTTLAPIASAGPLADSRPSEVASMRPSVLESEPPLPWDTPATASSQASTALSGDVQEVPSPPDASRSPSPPPSTQSQTHLAPAEATEQERAAEPPRSWISSIIDPPQPAPPGRPPGPVARRPADRQPPVPWQASPPAQTEHSVTTVDLTPAMAQLLKPPLPRDPIGDAIRWASDRFPSIDALLDRAWPDEKVGPFPLGIAAAAALAALFVVFGQAWPATVIIMIVVVLYAVPRAADVLSSGERTPPRAVRVTGTIQVKRTPDAISAGLPQLMLPSGETLSLRIPEYEALISLGRSVTVPWSAHGTAGGSIVVGHELPGMTVAYVSPNKMLLDVRNAEGAVIVRRSPYTGEPGDRLWTRDYGLPSGPPTAGGSASNLPREAQPGSPATGQQPSPTNESMHPLAQAEVLPIPPAAQAALKRAAERQKLLAIALAAFGLIGVGLLWGMMGAFSLFYLLFGVPVAVGIGWSHFSQAFKLAGANAPTSMVRVVGPVIVSKYRASKRYRCFVQFADGTRFRIGQGLCTKLESGADVLVEESWVFNFDESRRAPDGYLQSKHMIPAATSTFEPSTSLVLEVRNPFGGTVYRDRSLKDGDLGPYQPTI